MGERVPALGDQAPAPALRGRLAGIHLVLTSACNLRCSYCYQDRRSRRRMQWSTVAHALDILRDSGNQEPQIGFYGGEPLLAFDLVCRTVEEVKWRCDGLRPRFRLTTNGLLLDSAKAALLLAHDVETQVSFDGSRAAQERRAPHTFDCVARGLDTLRHEQPEFFDRLLEVAITLTPAAIPTLAESVERLVEGGIKTIALAPALIPGEEWDVSLERELDRQVHQIYDRSVRLYERTRKVPVTLFRRGPGRPVPSSQDELCAVSDCGSLAVDVDGEVYGCAMLAHSYQSFPTPGLQRWVAPLRIGRVEAPDLEDRLQSFRSIVRHSPLFARRDLKRSSQGRCGRCRFLAECPVCPADIARGGEDPHRVPDFLCAFSRISLSHRERFPAQLPSTASPRP